MFYCHLPFSRLLVSSASSYWCLSNLPSVKACDPILTKDFQFRSGMNAAVINGTFFTKTFLRNVLANAATPFAAVTKINYVAHAKVDFLLAYEVM